MSFPYILALCVSDVELDFLIAMANGTQKGVFVRRLVFLSEMVVNKPESSWMWRKTKMKISKTETWLETESQITLSRAKSCQQDYNRERQYFFVFAWQNGENNRDVQHEFNSRNVVFASPESESFAITRRQLTYPIQVKTVWTFGTFRLSFSNFSCLDLAIASGFQCESQIRILLSASILLKSSWKNNKMLEFQFPLQPDELLEHAVDRFCVESPFDASSMSPEEVVDVLEGLKHHFFDLWHDSSLEAHYFRIFKDSIPFLPRLFSFLLLQSSKLVCNKTLRPSISTKCLTNCLAFAGLLTFTVILVLNIPYQFKCFSVFLSCSRLSCYLSKVCNQSARVKGALISTLTQGNRSMLQLIGHRTNKVRKKRRSEFSFDLFRCFGFCVSFVIV